MNWIQHCRNLLLLAAALGVSTGCEVPDLESNRAETQPTRADTQFVDARLAWDVDAIRPGEPFRAGVLLTILDDTHIYYKHPGDSGLPTEVEWELPEGFEAGALQYPNPELFVIEELEDTSYGYEGEVLLFAEVTPPDDFGDTESIELSAGVYWLACESNGVCTPGEAVLEASLPVGDGIASKDKALFDGYAQNVARPADKTPVQANRDGETIRISVGDPWTIRRNSPEGPVYFPDEGFAWRVRPDLDEDSQTVVFEPIGEHATPPHYAGVMTLPVQNRTSGAKDVLYVRIDLE